MKKVYEEMLKSVYSKEICLVYDDGWMQAATLCKEDSDDITQNMGFTKYKFGLTFSASMILHSDSYMSVSEARHRLVDSVYKSLYGELNSQLSELKYHILNGDRETCEVLVGRLLDSLENR